MKIQHVHNQKRKGSVLIVSMAILAIGAVLLASYLTLVETQTNSVSRSQNWNSAMGLTEAGVEEAMALVNSGYTGNAWTNNIPSPWTPLVNNQTTLSRVLSTTGAGTNGFTVTIDISSSKPSIISAGYVSYVSEIWGTRTNWSWYGPSQPFIAAAGTTSSGATPTVLGRKVQVSTVLSPLFTVAILTKSNFDMNGQNTTVDSFDSSTNLYSSNGQWVASLRKAHGSVATDSSVVGDISLGNGNIYGHVYTGPGTAQNNVQIGPNGAVGDLAWQTGGNKGIETSFWSGNFNTSIPDVPAPTFSGLPIPPAQTNGPLLGDIVLGGGSSYTATASGAPSSSSTLVISGGPVNLWVKGAFSIPQLIFTNGGYLNLYIGTSATNGSDSLALAGNGSVNSPGYATNLLVWGLPSLTSISLSGNAAFTGAVYAPEAAFTGGGGGNNAKDSAGAMIVKSVTLSGHWNFHYDEALANFGPPRGWIANGWAELKYP
jgi:hypothetical protein